MNITKLVLTESDGTTVDTVSTTGGFSTVMAVLTDGTQVSVFPVPMSSPDPVVKLHVVTASGVDTVFVPEVV